MVGGEGAGQGLGLKRELRLVDVVALGVNGVIGSGIFFLPGEAAAVLGPAAVLAYLVSTVLCTLLVLSFAEVGGRFDGTGGPMLYGQAAFGDTVGFLVGWITWLVRVASWGALANGLVIAIDTLIPGVAAYKLTTLAVIFVGLAGANIAGVTTGARMTTLFAAAKLVPLAAFIVVGLFFLERTHFVPFAPHGRGSLGRGTLMIVYAFVGFEVLTVPGGEMRDPRRSVPRALLVTMAIVTVVYLGVWAVTTGTHPALAGSANPIAEAARHFLGPVGGTLIAIGIFLSVFGTNAGSALVAPRCLYALAEKELLPKALAHVHPRTRTPVVAIVVTAVISFALAASGSFVELAVLSVIGRFAQYVPTCLAVPVLRRRHEVVPATFTLPLGPVIPLLAIAVYAWLLASSEPMALLWGLVGLLSGLVFYLPTRYARSRS
jgi:amino acid transporter